MKFIVKSNESGHDFQIGEEIFPAACVYKQEHADAWVGYCQVFMQNSDNQAWWIGLDEMEIIKD